MTKFQRNYRLTVQSNGDDPVDVVIEYPMTLDFTIQRGCMASLNSASLIIYNLSESTRKQIFQDRFGYYDGVSGKLAYRRVTLEAGYGDDLAIVFQGNLFQAGSVRRGSDILTVIDARDGGFDTTTVKTFQTYAGGTTVKDLIESLIGGFPNLSLGAIGDYQDTFKRPVAIDGNNWDAIQLYTNNTAYIDLEKVYSLNNNEVVDGVIQQINADTGLLETPRRDDAYLTVTTLFEPGIAMGQWIELASVVMPIYNGKYKVIGVNHRGTISGSVNGQCQSVFGLLLDGQLFGKFKTVSSNITRANLSEPVAN